MSTTDTLSMTSSITATQVEAPGSTTLPPLLKSTNDPGVNYFINKVDTLPASNINIVDYFLPVYTITQSNTVGSLYYCLNPSNDTFTSLVKMNNSGSLKFKTNSITDAVSVDQVNPLIPTSSISETDFKTTPTPNPTSIISLDKLSNYNNTSNSFQKQYWSTSNQQWILYYGNDIKKNGNPTSTPPITGFALYYNPIYRPEFLYFLARNPKNRILPYWQRYCAIINNSAYNSQNKDPNCTQIADIPSVLKDYINRIVDVVVPPSAPIASAQIVDTIRISKNNGPLTITNLQILDYSNRDIIAGLSLATKTCNFASSSNNYDPYLYIYIGDVYVKRVVISANPATFSDTYTNMTVELLNNTNVVYTVDGICTSTANMALDYTKNTLVWDVGTDCMIPYDPLVSKVRVKRNANSTTLNLSEVQLISETVVNNTIVTKNILLGKTITANYNTVIDNKLDNSFTMNVTNNPEFVVDLANDATLLSNLSKFNIYNFVGNLNETQNVVVELLDNNNTVLASTISLPGGYYTYTWDFKSTTNEGLMKYDALGAVPIDGLTAHYTGDSYNLTTKKWSDISGNGNHVEPSASNSPIIGEFEAELINGYKAVKSKSYSVNDNISRVIFPNTNLQSDNYTLFTVARYTNASTLIRRRRIFDGLGVGANWLSGFWENKVGIAYRNSYLDTDGKFITPETSIYNTNNITKWVLSSDQRKLYRANGIDRTYNSKLSSSLNNQTSEPSNLSLTINYGNYSSEWSEWSVAEVIYYNRKLRDFEIRLVEKFLKNKYKLEDVVDNLRNPQPILAKRVKIVKPFNNTKLDLSSVTVFGNDVNTLIPSTNSGLTTATINNPEITVNITNNVYLKGNYVGGILINRKADDANMLAGCYIQLLDDTNKVLYQSDILMGGADRASVKWNIRNDSYDYWDNNNNLLSVSKYSAILKPENTSYPNSTCSNNNFITHFNAERSGWGGSIDVYNIANIWAYCKFNNPNSNRYGIDNVATRNNGGIFDNSYFPPRVSPEGFNGAYVSTRNQSYPNDNLVNQIVIRKNLPTGDRNWETIDAYGNYNTSDSPIGVQNMTEQEAINNTYGYGCRASTCVGKTVPDNCPNGIIMGYYWNGARYDFICGYPSLPQ
jgi:hypothetical protein